MDIPTFSPPTVVYLVRQLTQPNINLNLAQPQLEVECLDIGLDHPQQSFLEAEHSGHY